jgi:predicted nucleic acid-binding protein
MSVIVDTTVISNFASIGQLDVLRQLYGSLAISTDVYDEIQAGLAEGYRFYEGIEQWVEPLAEGGWIHLTSMSHEPELRYFRELPARLHRGENSSLAIARHRGWLLLTDDRAARTEATRLGVLVSGSLGCLVLAVERHLCSLLQANSWLQEMIHQGYHSPVTDLAPLLKRE